MTEASLLDARAAGRFAESRLLGARRETEMARRSELAAKRKSLEDEGASAAGEAGSVRLRNLANEIEFLDEDLSAMSSEAQRLRDEGAVLLRRADEAWASLATEGHYISARSRPGAPFVFSVELLNAGHGECILLHYGIPGSLRLVMLNAGPAHTYSQFLEPRLRELSTASFGGGPVPIEQLIISDRDAEKAGGLECLLKQIAETREDGSELAGIRGIWANLFTTGEGEGLRPRIRTLVDLLGLAWNRPFDYLVMRPRGGARW